MKSNITSHRPRGRGKRDEVQQAEVRRRAPLSVRRIMGRFGLPISVAFAVAEAAGFKNLDGGVR
jgi:hypothetical protein